MSISSPCTCSCPHPSLTNLDLHGTFMLCSSCIYITFQIIHIPQVNGIELICNHLSSTMVNPKRLVEMARKWRRMAQSGRRRILMSRTNSGLKSSEGSLASKGHFVVYTKDGRRFVVPLAHLNSNVFKELFRLSEEEFGLPGDRPIILPCDAVFMEQLVVILRRRISEDVEKALLNSIVSNRCSTSSSPFSHASTNSYALVHGF